MFPNTNLKKLFYWTIELLALAVLLFIASRLDFLMRPISLFIGTVFMPLLISGFLYYALKPILKLVERIKIKDWQLPRPWAVIITFVFFLLVVVGAVMIFVPIILNEITNLIKAVPSLVNHARTWTTEIINSRWFERLNISVSSSDVQRNVSKYASSFVSITAGTLKTVLSTATTVTINIFTIPIILFYMLNDSNRMVPALQKLFPAQRNEQVADLAGQMDRTIERYISGQAVQMLFVGFSMSIGYGLVGLPYIWLLGFIAGVANIVPYVGPWIGVIPALIVAATMSWKQVVFVLIIMAIVQQVVGSIIYPKMIGNALKIHPLTIMLLLLGAGNIWGILGMILIVPVYAIARTVLLYILAMRRVNIIKKSE
ncbi:AI-2E family transporter [Eupransor demetentiae]|uniref:Predicted PurR-regulated permease PerM (PerM) n=1 Tax=Eupransor demetentiae TaxID=3109584 RepID=A0ABM9N6C3_9LACO|nr:Predicted PurR-regulated permease PerM (PerM) [Lactobacillaceae bacterium LMG 33000]